MRLVPTLTLSLLTILWLERIALLLFLSAKEVSPSLSTAYFVALRPPFPIRQVQYVYAFFLKSAPFCMLLLIPAAQTTLPHFILSPFGLSFRPCYAFFFSVISSTSHSLTYLTKTILSLLLFYYPVTEGFQSIISPGK